MNELDKNGEQFLDITHFANRNIQNLSHFLETETLLLYQYVWPLHCGCVHLPDCLGHALQGGSPADVERYMMLAKESIVHVRNCAMDLRHLGQPNDNVVRT